MAKLTQNAKVMNWLRTRGELTTREAVTELNIMCLPKRIEELRKSGVGIHMEYRMSAAGSRYGVYSLAE